MLSTSTTSTFFPFLRKTQPFGRRLEREGVVLGIAGAQIQKGAAVIGLGNRFRRGDIWR